MTLRRDFVFLGPDRDHSGSLARFSLGLTFSQELDEFRLEIGLMRALNGASST